MKKDGIDFLLQSVSDDSRYMQMHDLALCYARGIGVNKDEV